VKTNITRSGEFRTLGKKKILMIYNKPWIT
jgi:hypothetical protein